MRNRPSWDKLAHLVAQLADADDTGLGEIVLDAERAAGCPMGPVDDSAMVLARRFARAHARALADGLGPVTHADLPLSIVT